MSIVEALRACAVSLRLAAVTALALALAAPALAFEARIGADTIEFGWTEAAGDPPLYAVWITRRGGAFTSYQLVTENRIELAVEPGDRVAIYVHGVRPDPGGWQFGPASEVSDTVYVLDTPRFEDAEAGHWLLHCAACRDSVQRELGDATVSSPQFAPPAPWGVVARAEFADGSRWLVWQGANGGSLMLSDLDDPAAPPIGPLAVPPGRFVDAIDVAGDGDDEFLFVDAADGNRLDRYTLAADGTLAWTGSAPGMVGGELGPVADYTGDGRDDLLWLHRTLDLVAVWSFTDFKPQQGVWRFRDSRVLDVAPSPGYAVVQAADYDGNGEVDLLWRGAAEGDLWINYVSGGAVTRTWNLPGLPGDETLEVVGSPETDAVPGAEIALRDSESGRIWILYPWIESFPAREAVFDAGPGYEVVYLAP